MKKIDSRTLVSLCPDPIIGVDAGGLINLFNAAAQRLLGYNSEEVIGRLHISEIYTSLDHAKEIKRLIQSNDFGECGFVEGYETVLKSALGQEIPIRLSASLLEEHDGGGSVGFFHDMSERKRLEEKLKKQSITDELTGLYNQRHFYGVLSVEMDRAERYQSPLSLICVDLDNLKQVNDQLGHLEGDRILRDVSRALRECSRSVDACFRYGGDEFMVLLPQTDCIESAQLAERIRMRFNEISRYSIDLGNTVVINASLSLGVTDTLALEDVDHFIQRADLAMYEAKNAGGNRTMMIKRQVADKVEAEV
ncbi:GGDEF domain-containing protein [Pontibacterium sp. N1Y112]|uniref:diguanylate cyclase n=1 Tax=Pontibacterium sinense TaxID=2781979 RepID=A0A8J7K714_9GAMM|nr:sensor domain-containing diguanylate cyclase [Pontibacterium sinense]MBE9399350.1 GGDEF domain-containing protein [Pontibacterium sinense]